MGKIRVVVTDDAPMVRELISTAISTDPDIEVVGKAENGKIAVEMVASLKPDIVTMDIHMPVMSGLEAIPIIMENNPTPILVISSLENSLIAYDTVSKGALDVFPKGSVDVDNPRELIRKIKLYSKIKVIRHIQSNRSMERRKKLATAKSVDRVVVIASSTGGPRALASILKDISSDFPYPIVIAQHIEVGFIEGLAEWLNNVSPLTVKKAADREVMLPGYVYLNPPETDMEISTGNKLLYKEQRQGSIYHPSCNRLLMSAVDIYGDRTIGIILTGMGDDGADAMAEIKKAGGDTVAQDEETCVVFGMPNVAIQKNGAKTVLPIENIAAWVNRLVKKSERRKDDD